MDTDLSAEGIRHISEGNGVLTSRCAIRSGWVKTSAARRKNSDAFRVAMEWLRRAGESKTGWWEKGALDYQALTPCV